jgi:hypothetical protein
MEFPATCRDTWPRRILRGFTAVVGTRRPARRRPITLAKKKHHHHVYVIELDPAIYNVARFRRANPDHDITKPCVYVGCTGLTPEQRFAKHKAGVRANRYVQRFGLRLLPRLYAYANPMPYNAARDMEVELAIALREEGYAVWQG